MNDLSSLVRDFSRQRVLVLGDVMLDEYIDGVVDRISPEAPIPVLLQKKVRHTLGGAGNVAANAAALGAKVTLIGVVGTDPRGKILGQLARKSRIASRILPDTSRPTTTKIRFVSGHHQLVRIDIEEAHPIAGVMEGRMIRMIRSLPSQDAVIISDYAKGVVTKNVLKALRAHFGAKKIIADMKPVHAALYKGVYAITPNIKEAALMTGVHATNDMLAERVTRLLAKQLHTSVILTRGEHGVSAREKGKLCRHIHNSVQTVKDVTGAGDPLVSVFALASACGAAFLQAAAIANYAAGIVVGKAGTVVLTKKELQEGLPHNA